MKEQEDILKEIEDPIIQKSKLLPLWIKIFAGIFLIVGIFVPVVVIIGMTGRKVLLSIYGFEALDVISLYGIMIIFIYLLKGVAAFGFF